MHALDELIRSKCEPTSAQYLVSTEGLATLDRLAFEMVTGDTTKRPTRLWRQFMTMISIQKRGWPWIDPEVINLVDLTIQAIHWPRDEGGIPYFTQMAALRYHYGIGIANQQQFVLSNLLAQYSYKTPYRRAVEGIRHIIENVMRNELFRFLLDGFTIIRLRTQSSGSFLSHNTDHIMHGLVNSEDIGQAITEWETKRNPLSSQ